MGQKRHIFIAVCMVGLTACSDDVPGNGTDAGLLDSIDERTATPDAGEEAVVFTDGEIDVDGHSADAPSDADAMRSDGKVDADATPPDGMLDGDVATTVTDGPIDLDRISSDTPDLHVYGDAGCPGTPVAHGMSCTGEGSIACGRMRSCTDIGSDGFIDCVCRNGRYVCGTCPHCSVDLRSNVGGCGLGQVCDGMTVTLCDGSQLEVDSTCSCQGFYFTCENTDATYGPRGCDGGADTGTAD
jgi:hypothetical protein